MTQDDQEAEFWRGYEACKLKTDLRAQFKDKTIPVGKYRKADDYNMHIDRIEVVS